jgi:hypothetical protein
MLRPFARHIALLVVAITEYSQLPDFLLFITTFRLKKLRKHAVAEVPKLCSADPLGTATSSQGIRGYISVIATLKFTY